jgi:hypothetical protein
MGERLKYVPLSFHLSHWTSTEKLIACGIEKYYKDKINTACQKGTLV